MGRRSRDFQNAGLKLNKLIGEDWRTYPDFSLSTMQSSVDKDPGMVIAIARGVAKATVYALANPECAVKLHWQHYPATKPTGADEATLIKWDLNAQQAQLDCLRKVSSSGEANSGSTKCELLRSYGQVHDGRQPDRQGRHGAIHDGDHSELL